MVSIVGFSRTGMTSWSAWTHPDSSVDENLNFIHRDLFLGSWNIAGLHCWSVFSIFLHGSLPRYLEHSIIALLRKIFSTSPRSSSRKLRRSITALLMRIFSTAPRFLSGKLGRSITALLMRKFSTAMRSFSWMVQMLRDCLWDWYYEGKDCFLDSETVLLTNILNSKVSYGIAQPLCDCFVQE